MAPSRKLVNIQLGIDPTQRHKTFYQIRDLLKLDNSQFVEMKDAFLDVTTSHFDIDEVGCVQVEALKMAVEDLKSQFPALFTKGDINIEQRETLVRRAFLLMQSIRRKRRGIRRTRNMKGNKKTFKKDKKDAISETDNHSQENNKPDPHSLSSAKPGPSLTQRMAANLLSIKNGSRAPKIFASPPRTLRNAEPSSSNEPAARLPLLDIPASSGSLSPTQRPPVPPPQTPHPDPDASFSIGSMSELGVPHTQISPSPLDSSYIYRSKAFGGEGTSISNATTSSSTMVAGSSTSASCGDTQGCSAVPPLPPQNVTQIRSVYNFLEAVVPPMTHLLHRFVEFGCLGEDYLFAISTWDPERIYRFLKSLPPGPEGSTLTKMEMGVLAYHFETYFLASKS